MLRFFVLSGQLREKLQMWNMVMHTLYPNLSWHYSFKLNGETVFSMQLFVPFFPPLPCQHHVCPGRSMWQAAGIILTFSTLCSSASLSQAPQSSVNHLGQQQSEPGRELDIIPWKTKVLHGTKMPIHTSPLGRDDASYSLLHQKVLGTNRPYRHSIWFKVKDH